MLANPNVFTFFDNLIPFTTASEVLIDEKLPGPLLTSIEKLLFNFTLCFLSNLIY